MNYSIAIDGPAGAGKSTIAKNIAKKLDFMYVDTGAMYRSIGVYCNEHNIDVNDENAVSEACKDADMKIIYMDGAQQIILNSENITGRLRTEEAGKAASRVAVYKAVREKLVDIQRETAKAVNLIMDGRDIGTCVLPNATLKVYLTASVKTRALRRWNELKEKGENPDIKFIEEDIEKRDNQDMTREISPLRKADDAELIDSSDMDIEQVTDEIIRIFNEKVDA